MHSLITAFYFTFRATSNKQNYLNQPTHYEPIITPQIMLNNNISTNITMLLIQLIMMSNYMNIFFSLAVTFLLTPKLASVVSSTNLQHNFTRKVWAFEKDYKQYLYIHTHTHAHSSGGMLSLQLRVYVRTCAYRGLQSAAHLAHWARWRNGFPGHLTCATHLVWSSLRLKKSSNLYNNTLPWRKTLVLRRPYNGQVRFLCTQIQLLLCAPILTHQHIAFMYSCCSKQLFSVWFSRKQQQKHFNVSICKWCN